MTKIILKYREARAGELGLFHVDQRGAGVVGRVKLGQEVTADVRRARNTRQLRLFWVIVDFVAMHCPLFEGRTEEDIADTVKVATGHVRKFINTETGEVFYVTKSIAETKLDQAEFEDFFEKACLVIAKRWMPEGTTAETVRAELLAMIDGPGAIGSKVA